MRKPRFLTALLSVVLLLSAALPAAAETESRSLQFDFSEDEAGFRPIFADLPAAAGTEDFYELVSGRRDVPVEGAGGGLYLSGNNHSDDLFMGYYVPVTGLTPGERYAFRVSFRLATNVDGGQMGVGGSPGSSVYVKGGVCGREPCVSAGGDSHLRLNLDKGNQAVGGADMALLGNLEKPAAAHSSEYALKDFSFRAEAAADETGTVWLILGTDSGFESTSSYYLTDITLRWTTADAATLTRAEAVELLYAARGEGAMAFPSFVDAAMDAPYYYALGWAERCGIVLGCGDARFEPENDLTGVQAALMLYRLAGSPAQTSAPVPGVPDWAQDATAWAAAQALFSVEELAAPLRAAAFRSALERLDAEK